MILAHIKKINKDEIFKFWKVIVRRRYTTYQMKKIYDKAITIKSLISKPTKNRSIK
jgi:hypothetical protein